MFHKMRRKSVKQLQSMREVLGQYERVSVSNIDELLESINSDLNDLKKTAKEQVWFCYLARMVSLVTNAAPACSATTNSVRGPLVAEAVQCRLCSPATQRRAARAQLACLCSCSRWARPAMPTHFRLCPW